MTIGYAIKKLLQVYNVPVFYWNSQYWNCRKAQRPKFNAKILTLKGPKKLVIGPNLGRGPRSGHPCCTVYRLAIKPYGYSHTDLSEFKDNQ